MKAKTITKILTGKFLSWCKSIEDEKVRELVKNNTIITGGSIVSLLLDEEVNDFDIYFRDHKTALAVAQYYVKKLLENPPPAFKDDPKHKVDIHAILEPAIPEGKEEMRVNGIVKGPQEPRVRIVVKSAGIASGEQRQTDYQYFEGIQNADTQAAATDQYVSDAMGESYAEGQVTDETEPEAYVSQVEKLDNESASVINPIPDAKAGKGKGKYHVLFVTSNAITLSDQIQIVLRFQGEPEQIHKNYDFVHCTNTFTSWDYKLTLNPEALECILTKELRYIGSKYPLCSVIRLRKFISRGWTVNAGQILKMLFQISKMDLTDPMVLEDQLVGVDSAYFSQLIEQLKQRKDEDGNVKKVDGTYLATLIDKIF